MKSGRVPVTLPTQFNHFMIRITSQINLTEFIGRFVLKINVFLPGVLLLNMRNRIVSL